MTFQMRCSAMAAASSIHAARARLTPGCDESMPVARHIGSEHADLAVRDLPCRPRILPCHAARCLTLFEEAGFIDDDRGDAGIMGIVAARGEETDASVVCACDASDIP